MSINKLAFTPGIKQNKQPNIKRVESKAKYHEFKSSSTSNIFLNSTISSPNVKNMIKAVATILQSQLNEDMNLGKTISKKSDLFDISEKLFFLRNISFTFDIIKFLCFRILDLNGILKVFLALYFFWIFFFFIFLTTLSSII